MKISEPAGEAGERLFFHGPSCELVLLCGDKLRAQFTVSSVISPVVCRVNITGNRFRVVAQRLLSA